MLFFDMFFLFMGQELKSRPEEPWYFYLTKNMEVKETFHIHTETLAIQKIVRERQGQKLIVSLGFDEQLEPLAADKDFPSGVTFPKKLLVIKIWDLFDLAQNTYLNRDNFNLTGGYSWTMAGSPNEKPKFIPILYQGKPYLNEVVTFKASRDGTIAALALPTHEILILNLASETSKNAKILKLSEFQYQEILDLHFGVHNNVEQVLYVVSKGGALAYRQIDKKEERKPLVDQMHIKLTANCSDVDEDGKLWLEQVRQQEGEEEDHIIARFSPVAGEPPM